MKKLFLIALFAISLISLANAAAIKVIVNDVSPQPAEPGNDLTVRITFSNVDSDFASSTARLDLRPPFALKTSTESFESGFDLCAFCSRTNAYFIHVDSQASSGTYPVFVRMNQEGSESVRTINVTVRGKPNIVLLSDAVVNATPASVLNMKVRAANIGTGAERQIKIVSKSSDFISLGSSVITINEIIPGNESSVTYLMSVGSDLKAGGFSLPFEISYLDESGASYNSTQNLGAQVINKARLGIASTRFTSGGGEPVAGVVSIIIRLENTGRGTADSVESELSCDGRAGKAFLGQLKRDEDVPAVFEMQLPAGQNECTLTTRYSDDLGDHSVKNKLAVHVKSPEFPVMSVVILIIILGAVYYFAIRKRRKKKDE